MRRRTAELNLHALDSCRAHGLRAAMQSLLKGRSPYVLACLWTVVPVDISRVALTEVLE